MSSKSLILFGVLALFVITFEVVLAKDLAETSNVDGHSNEVNAHGGGGGYPDGGYPGGGYPGGGYPGGGYPGNSNCHFGCCGRRDYRGYCLRCCGLNEAANTQNEVNDIGSGGGYPGGGYPGGSNCHFGCCGRRDYRGYCLRCCGLNEAGNAQVEVEPNN